MSGSKEAAKKGFNEESEKDLKPAGSARDFNTFQADLHRDLSDLSRQVRMISDSLAAYKQISRRRQINTCQKENSSRLIDPNLLEVAYGNAQSSVSAPEEETLKRVCPKEEEKSTVLWCLMQDRSPLNKSKGFDSGKEIFSTDLNSNSDWKNGWNEVAKESSRTNSKVGLYQLEEVDWEKLLEVTQRELKTLMEMAPSVALIVIELSDIIFHYKECSRCNRKFQGYLPQILNRIQNLIKHVTNKRGKTYVWPNDYSYLQLSSKSSGDCHIEEEESVTVERKRSTVLLGKLEKVDAIVVSEDKPGVQIQLLVQPEKTKKRFYETVAKKKVAENLVGKEVFAILQLREFAYNLVVYVLRPSRFRRVVWEVKQEVVSPRGESLAVGIILVLPRPKELVAFVAAPVGFLCRIETAQSESFLRGLVSCEERRLAYKSNVVNILIRQTGRSDKICQKEVSSDEQRLSRSKNFYANASKLVQELLKEADEEDMQVQKVKDLEVEIKGLKDLMLEVHKNQIELSKVLLEKEIYSQPIIKLTDPRMLEEENRAVSRAAQMEMPRRTSSAEDLQKTVNELKKKCVIKNRMIVTLLKGLRSNVPKEWWEELVDCIFNESKPIEEFNSERVNEFIRQTSLYLVNVEKASTEKPPSSPNQDSLSEDVPWASSREDLGDSDHELEVKESQEKLREMINEKRKLLMKQTERLSSLIEPKHTSSFIQNILYEDSQAGVAVVDLFVAVKRAKDKLNTLTKINNEASNKVNTLRRHTVKMKVNYRELVGSVNDFFEKMSDTAKNWAPRFPQALAVDSDSGMNEKTDLKRESEDAKLKLESNLDERLGTERNPPVDQLNRDRELSSKWANQRGTGSSFSSGQCMAGKDRSMESSDSPVQIINMTPEDVMAAVIVNSLRKKQYDFKRKNSDDSGAGTCQNQIDGTQVRLSEANVQMICDICEMLSLMNSENQFGETSTFKEIPKKSSSDPEEQVEEVDSGAGQSSRRVIVQGKEMNQNLEALRREEGCEDREDNVSEGDSVFEEALSEPVSETKQRPNVSCMGDLTKSSNNKKSVSTLTTNYGMVETSWMGKLAEDIKSTLRNLRPNFKKQMMIPGNDFEKPVKSFGGLEFTISANTPVGVFDVTVRQFKQFRQKTDGGESCAPIKSIPNSVPESEKFNSNRSNFTVKDSGYYWSDESLQNSDSDHLSSANSVSGADEMEEFIEVYVQSKKSEANSNKASVSLKKGNMLKATLKQDRVPIFEVEKFHPQYFVQEILPKRARIRNGKNSMGIVKDSEMQERRSLIVEDNSDDLIIYIQVEVDEEEGDDDDDEDDDSDEVDDEERDSKKIYIECKSSLEEIPVRIEEMTRPEIDFAHEEETVEASVEGDGRELKKAIKPLMVDRSTELEEDLFFEESEKEIVFVKEPKKKSVTFHNVSGDDLIPETEISQVLPKEDWAEVRLWETPVLVRFLHVDLKADICMHLPQFHHISRMDVRKEKEPKVEDYVRRNAPELEKAINLIREIENNVVGVKLSNAILILPNLESELRKHLQRKMKGISEREESVEDSTKEFFSAFDFWPKEEGESKDSDDSEERLHNLFALLSDLENAVRLNESSKDSHLCDCNSSRICHLLHALTESIRDLENGASMAKLAETVNIASQLDSAVREYDGIIKKQVEDYGRSSKSLTAAEKDSTWKAIPVRDHMRNVRKKVFQTVEGEAIKTECRIERDFDRIDRLERENEEAMKFVEAFLEKTTRRTAELDLLKRELQTLSSTLERIYVEIVRQQENEKSLQGGRGIANEEESVGRCQTAEEEPVKDTVSGLLQALNNLKSRAREKNEVCKEILEVEALDTTTKIVVVEKKISRSSRSSFTTAKATDDLLCTIKDFRRIGETSLYMAWSKPEGALADHVTGYEVVVNGKLNQKVRNPERTQAVLYSVDLTRKVDIQLYGLTENRPKKLLAALTHYDT